MREIKFRGKSNVLGWVYGCYAVVDGHAHIFEEDDLVEDGHHIRQESDRPTLVDENTIGQYTGLKDANGKEIYEGDIVKSVFNKGAFGVVTWHSKGYFYLLEVSSFRENYGESDHRTIGEMLKLSIDGIPCNFKVVGNIHDDSKLV